MSPIPVEAIAIGQVPIGFLDSVLRGPPGAAGADFRPDATGLLADRGDFDSEEPPFAFLATDTRDLYFRQGNAPGGWSDPVPFGGTGQPGTGSGDVVGPSSSVNGRAAIFSGPTGKVIAQAAAAPVLEGDSRLEDSRTPTDHAASHGSGGSDPITVAQSQVTGLPATLAGKADLIGGVIPTSQLPSLAITEFLGTAANQAAMLALSGQRGDWCVRTDAGVSGGTWVLITDGGSSLAHWVRTGYPIAPVSSVNGQTGDIVLGFGDVGAAPASQGVTGGNDHDHNGGDGAQIAYGSLSGRPTIPALSDATPAALGTAAAGTSPTASRSDHVHALTSFTQNGTGAVARTVSSKLTDFVSVRDFGAVGDGVADDTAAIQAAINSGKAAFVPEGTYLISGTLTLDKSYQALIGSESRPIIRKNNAGAAIRVVATLANPLNLYCVVANLNLENTSTPVFRTTPTLADAGIVLDGNTSNTGGSVKYTRVENIRISNWSVGYYANDVVNGCVKNVYAHLLSDFSAVGGYTSANKFVGFLLECTPFTAGGVSPQASNEYVRCDAVGLRTPVNVQSIGFYMIGSDLRDVFFSDCECAVTTLGWHVKSTGGSDFNWNIQIQRPIIDAFGLHGIWIDGLTGPGCVTIDGGYIVGTGSAASHAIYILNSNGVTVTGGAQILGHANNLVTDMGVRIDGGGGHSIVGNSLQNLNYPITLINSAKLCTVMGNAIFASATDTEANPTLNEAIRLLSGAEENTIIGNTIRGKDNTDRYEVGISVGSGCPRNMISGNVIDEDGTVVTPYSITDTTTTLMNMGMVQSGRRLILRGNDGTYPIEFQDSSGTAILRINSSGGLDPAPSGSGGGTKTLARFTARDNQPPAADFATLDQRNSISVLEFDAATEETAAFVGAIPEGANLASGLLVRIWWMADTATTGNVRWAASFEDTGTDLDADSFDTATEVTSTANGTSGIETVASITCTAIDSLAAGDRFRLRIARKAADATNDTMAGDAQLVAVEVRGVA